MSIHEFLFWASVGLLAYIYVGYPAVVLLLASTHGKKLNRAPYAPRLSLIIPAYNETTCIRDTIKNKLELDYPKEKLEIIVVSDGSTDRTDEIVREFESDGVRLVRQDPRRGKTAALNLAVEKAQGEILVFSDANSLYDADALRHLASAFADPDVGYVTGRMMYAHPKDGASVSEGCSMYMRYETLVRLAETRVGSVVGVNGGIDAVRRELYRPMRVDQQSDFVLPMMVVERGFRVVFEPRAVLRETPLVTAKDEYRMRVRVSLRALCAMWDMKHLLNPFRYGVYSWQLLSHKLLRYLTFVPLSLVYGSSLSLFQKAPLFQAACVFQTALYLGALLGWILDRHGRSSRILILPYYFCLLNLASAHSFGAAVRGHRQSVWSPRKG